MTFLKKNAFSIVVLVNILLKTLYLGVNPFSFDEIISVKDTLLEFGHIKHEAEWDNNPPFYYYCLWVWHSILPINEFNTRLLSVVFASFSIGLLFNFTKRYFNTTVAVAAVGFTSFSNFIFYYSQESRAYALVLLLSISSTILFFRYVENRKVATLFWLALINFLLIYTHYISSLVIVFQYLLFPFISTTSKSRFYLFQSSVIIILVFLRFTKKQYLNIVGFNSKGDFWLQKAGLIDLKHALVSLSGSFALLIVFSFIVIVFLIREKSIKKHGIYFFYCFTISVFSVLFLFIVGTFKSVFLARYLIFTIPFFAIVVSYMVSTFLSTSSWIYMSLLILVVAQNKFKRDVGVDYRQIANVLKKVKTNSDLIVLNRADNLLPFAYYYNKEIFMTGKDAIGLLKENNIVGMNDSKALPKGISPCSFIFVVQATDNPYDPQNNFLKQLSSNGALLYSTTSIAGFRLSIKKCQL